MVLVVLMRGEDSALVLTAEVTLLRCLVAGGRGQGPLRLLSIDKHHLNFLL